MDADVKEVIDFLKGDESNLWEIDLGLDSTDWQKPLAKVFTPEQLEILKQIVKQTVKAIEWHNKNDEESHSDIRKARVDLEAKFRNHRHELDKTFSAKPEY